MLDEDFFLEAEATNKGSQRQQQLQEIRSGGSYLSQSDLHLHFGLGKSRIIDKVEVMWPNGATQTFTNLQPDHFYSLKQNGNLVLTGAPAHPPH